ncbi:MAG: sulfotransferase [Micromonosporaceae bacterium]|nr:sulfotransferase [Micromonosporaceae bacterium]
MTRVLFLGGLGRSGTTLVERVLGELPGVVALGEVVHLWQRDLRDGERCGCGEPFRRCRFWREVGEQAFGGWHRLDVARVLRLRHRVERTRHVPRLAAADRRSGSEIAEYAGYYRRVYAAAARVAGARLVVDSSKHGALAWCLRHSAAVDLRVVQMVRDPRAVAHSWTRRVIRPESRGVEMTRYRPGHSALLWNAQNAALGLLSWRGVPVHRLRYERFVADPAGAVRELARFAGLGDLSAADLAFLEPAGPDEPARVSLGRSHSAAGNPMRFTVGTVPVRRDDAWYADLPPRHRWLVGAVCAPLLAAYGYPLRPRRPGDRPAGRR